MESQQSKHINIIDIPAAAVQNNRPNNPNDISCHVILPDTR